MFRKKKFLTVRDSFRSLLGKMGRFGSHKLAFGTTQTLFWYHEAFAEAKAFKGAAREELGENGYMRFEYTQKGLLTLTVGFDCFEGDDMFDLVRTVFYENEKDAFDGYDKEDRPYHLLRFVRGAAGSITKAVYELEGVAFEEVTVKADRLLDYVNNTLDILHDEMDDEFGEG